MEEKMTQVAQPIEHMLERLSVDTVFGEPTQEGDVTIIPVAEIGFGFGYGYGWGQCPSGAVESEEEAACWNDCKAKAWFKRKRACWSCV